MKISIIKYFTTLAVLRQSVKRVYGAHLRVIGLTNIASFEEMLQRRQAVGNTVYNLTCPRFEPYTSRSRDERATARPTC